MSASARGRPRREAILDLVVPAEVTVDVGCDHGHVAAALTRRGLFVVGVERRSRRLPRRQDIPLVVADGLRPFARVDQAILTGMGGQLILDILAAGPRPRVAVVHSPDRTDLLREGLARAGWRIEAERLAPEARGFAEVMRVVPGEEPARGHALKFGPHVPADPLALPHARRCLAHWRHIAAHAPPGSLGQEQAAGWLGFLEPLHEQLLLKSF